jgi:hypothetical protein
MDQCGVSANLLHGFGRFNLQNDQTPNVIHALEDHCIGLEEEDQRNHQAEHLCSVPLITNSNLVG